MSKVIIVGAGIGGLTTGIELLEAGFEVDIFEKNESAGGLCSGYYVDGHYIDACLHWLIGTKNKTSLNNILRKTDALNDQVEIISLPTLGTVEYQGETVTFYRDLKKSEEEWIKKFPEDTKEIKRFLSLTKDIGKMMCFLEDVSDDKNFLKFFKTMFSISPNYGRILASMRKSKEAYASRFKSPALRFAIKNIQTGYNNAFFLLDEYGMFTNGNADLPKGGSIEMIKRIKNRFLSLGGKLYLSTPIDEIIVKDNVAIGVKSGNKEFFADIIVSSVAPTYTLMSLLKKKYSCPKIEKANQNITKYETSSCYCLYVTVEEDISSWDVPIGIEINNKVGKNFSDYVVIRQYGFDKEYFVKDGKTVVSFLINQDSSDYFYWKSLYDSSKEEYKKEIDRVNLELLDVLFNRFPKLKGKVKILDYFSPVELEKRTNSTYGAIQAYSFTDKGAFHLFNGEIKGLKNFYMSSQWNKAIGGTPMAFINGDMIAKRIIKRKQS